MLRVSRNFSGRKESLESQATLNPKMPDDDVIMIIELNGLGDRSVLHTIYCMQPV
ncbi:hypothetical protein SS1G_14429 [Sclerotinia sclerotiorum 1980 UF-70]|uniref:Uncharacterized protein n=1 Tax=Sclerotinia sclerotiorum (strain ATCC 18683 / 1980 / Ss-1) TaxID=665079 RepID=A7F9Z8_SCLS1|nr:hypothetical protein SS1G_14429 [Sclerotinia sclerotiorum 1980 UF-70]EDO00559.1 hypothetical protein SS1G_14429 [Sclerotinia sclerotiorum 1980 UF-70]